MGEETRALEDHKIRDLEMVEWMDEEKSMRGMAIKSGVRIEEPYRGYDDLYAGILKNGPLVWATPKADVILLAVDGEFDGHIVALRQSGRNVRRFLVREDLFENQYGTVENCLNHLLSNNAVDCEIELKHLYDMGEKFNLLGHEIEPERNYDRLEIDLKAAIQLTGLMEKRFRDDVMQFQAFELGYCVGRLFSSAQNLATLEPDAAKAHDYEKSYKERGKKGKSKDRKRQRLDHLFESIARLLKSNPAFSRLMPVEVARIALEDAVKEKPKIWSQGQGQLSHYLNCYASNDNYRQEYRKMFPKTG